MPESTPPAMSAAERFLFTGLSETERQRMEEQIFLDDGLFEEVLAAEDDLIDAAVRGELDQESQKRLAHLPDLEQRLAFARQLAKATVKHRAKEHPATSSFRWRPWLSSAALLLLVLGLGWIGSVLLRDSTAEFVLRPAAVRSAGPELVIAPEVAQIELHLELPRDVEASLFRVRLETEDGVEIKRWEHRFAQHADWGVSVVVDFAAAELTPGSYSATLLGIDGKGAEKELGIYSVTIVFSE